MQKECFFPSFVDAWKQTGIKLWMISFSSESLRSSYYHENAYIGGNQRALAGVVVICWCIALIVCACVLLVINSVNSKETLSES